LLTSGCRDRATGPNPPLDCCLTNNDERPGCRTGACPVSGLPCGPTSWGLMRRRIKNRILHSWHWMRAGDTALVVAPTWRKFNRPPRVEAVDDGYEEARLAAEAGAWLRIHVMPAIKRGELADADADALGLWLSTQAKLTDHSLHQILIARAEAGDRSLEAVHREFYRKANRAFRVLKIGILCEGKPIKPAPGWPE
jgi:hypothetical protein